MTKRLRVALVDDDRIYQFTTERLLQRIGVEVEFVWFRDGEEALNYIADNAANIEQLPDIIIVDINMPFLDGWQFLDAFKSLRKSLAKNVDIYMVSSSNDDRDVARARQTEGVRDYVEKPITREKLAFMLQVHS